MPELKINGISVKVEDGSTVLDAARALDIDIPTLCHLEGCDPETSCMLCVVKNGSTGQLIPSCSAKALDGMVIDTNDKEVGDARRDILNLLLSEHAGDCEAPCTRICPAHLDIPSMLREIERGNLQEAGWIARRDLAIPVVLGHICPAPCEKGCRRGQLDQAIKIRDSHREAAPHFQSLEKPFPRSGKPVAVIGSGAAGLSCAWELLKLGYVPTVFEEAEQVGGSLRLHEDLPKDVLDEEIRWLKQAGILFRVGETDPDLSSYDAILEPEEHKLAVMAVAKGKSTAQDFHGKDSKRFDSKVGKLRESEVAELSKNCSSHQDADDMANESARCLHCDCRKPNTCKLRQYAEQYGADQKEFRADERKHIQLLGTDDLVVFESGKCIKCGLCVKVAKQSGEEIGVTFVGRGYNTEVAVPFGEALKAGLSISAEKVVAICPTGALAFRDAEEKLDGITG